MQVLLCGYNQRLIYQTSHFCHQKDSLDEIAEHLHDNQSHLQDSEAVNVRSLQEELTRLGERQQRSNRNVQKQLKTMNEILQALLIAQSSSQGNLRREQVVFIKGTGHFW